MRATTSLTTSKRGRSDANRREKGARAIGGDGFLAGDERKADRRRWGVGGGRETESTDAGGRMERNVGDDEEFRDGGWMDGCKRSKKVRDIENECLHTVFVAAVAAVAKRELYNAVHR